MRQNLVNAGIKALTLSFYAAMMRTPGEREARRERGVGQPGWQAAVRADPTWGDDSVAYGNAPTPTRASEALTGGESWQHRDREYFEVASLRDVARAARRLRLAMRINTLMPGDDAEAWVIASLNNLDRTLDRLETIEDAISDADAAESPDPEPISAL